MFASLPAAQVQGHFKTWPVLCPESMTFTSKVGAQGNTASSGDLVSGVGELEGGTRYKKQIGIEMKVRIADSSRQ
jgi:hypothetical protein